MTTDPEFEQQLRSIGREVTSAPTLDADTFRRIQRRRGASALLATCVLLVLGGGTTMSINMWRNSESSNSVAPADRSPTQSPRVPYLGSLGVAYDTRAGWHSTSSSLTPRLDPDYQLVAGGTAPLLKGGGPCPRFPVRAIEAMGSKDAFFDLTRDPFRQGRYFPPRPTGFEKVARHQTEPDAELQRCITNPDVQGLYWLPFEEHRMFFHLLIAEGSHVSPKIERELWHSVDGLVISGLPR